MQRDTTHSPVLDDELAAETRHITPGTTSRDGGWRDPEIPLEGETGGQAASPLRSSAPIGMTPDDVEGRFRMARWLETGKFPATAQQIRDMAMDADAPDVVQFELSRLPDGEYDTVTEVWKALGHGVETSRTDMPQD